MQALRWHARGDVRLDEVEEPTPVRADDVVIAVELCGVCGSDVAEVANGPRMIRETAHPLTGMRPPVTLGHEFSGRVHALGTGIDDLTVGQLVTVDPCIRCGTCAACTRGDYHLCRRGGAIGLAADGALAQLVRVRREQVIPVPADVSAAWAAVAEPLAVGLHAARRAGVGPGDSVLVTGAGPIGVAAILGAISLGAGAVHVSEPVPERAERALGLGATAVHDPTRNDLRRELRTHTSGDGFDAAIDTTGHHEAIGLAVESLRRGGRVSVAGISANSLALPVRQLVLYERELVGSLGYHCDIERVLQLMAAGRLDASPFTSTIRPLSAAAEVLHDLAASPTPELKILIDPKE